MAVDKPFVVILITIEGNHLALHRVLLEGIGQEKIVGPVVPLGELLALGSRNLHPLREEINPPGDRDLHSLVTIGKPVLVLIKRAITVGRDRHEETPPVVFILVLEELKKLLGGGNGDIKTNMIASRLRSKEPTFLISLEREIPMLVKETDDTVETWGSRGHGVIGERQIGTNLESLGGKESVEGWKECLKTRGFIEAASWRDSDKL